MAFKMDEERMNAGGGGGHYITRPGDYTLRVDKAEESSSNGVLRLSLTCSDVGGAGAVSSRFDLDGAYAWRTDRLMQAMGVRGYDKPGELVGKTFCAEVRLQRNSDKYMEIGRVWAQPAPSAPEEPPF